MAHADAQCMLSPWPPAQCWAFHGPRPSLVLSSRWPFTSALTPLLLKLWQQRPSSWARLHTCRPAALSKCTLSTPAFNPCLHCRQLSSRLPESTQALMLISWCVPGFALLGQCLVSKSVVSCNLRILLCCILAAFAALKNSAMQCCVCRLPCF